MTRSEYLNTVKGQRSEHIKRFIKTISLVVNQEPKGKNSSDDEKRLFRNEISKQLKAKNRKAFRGDIILKIDYYTTKNNPPELHTLSKNYIDLLHKEMTDIDSLKGILYKDDNQIKILISNYHIDENTLKKPCIELEVCSLQNFLADIELAQRIITNNFSDLEYSFQSRFKEEFDDLGYNNDKDYLEELRALESGEDYRKIIGKRYYNIQKSFLLRNVQEKFLKQSNLDIISLISIFKPYFSQHKKHFESKYFQSICFDSRNLISFSPTYLNIGAAPKEKGETNIFKTNLQKELKSFREKFEILFPLLHPISVIITFIPPKQNVIDLDNLAKIIVPYVNELFKPPTIFHVAFKDIYSSDFLKIEHEIIQRFPPNSIASYQLVQLPRLENDPENGKIEFLITEGFYNTNNIWRTVDKIISKWKGIY